MVKRKKCGGFVILTILFLLISFCVWKHTDTRPLLLFKRIELVLLLYIFGSLHFFIDINKMYQWIHKYRLLVVLMLIIFCVLNCFNGSSLGMYDQYIQPNLGSDYITPVFGKARAIRSDEWMVNIPRLLSASYSGYGRYNDLVRAEKSINLVASGGLMLDYCLLYSPSTWGFYLFGSAYGVSFQWAYKIFVGFLVWYDLFLILTKNKKLLSFFGACLIWFSSFNLWWSIVSQLISGAAIVVLFYYFVREDNKIKRLLIGMCLAIAGADFACNLYPAWQVPMGYIVLFLLVWILVDNKKRGKYKLCDWLILIFDVIFMLSIIGRYIWMDMEYITEISKTVYPGSRVSYGGFSLNKLLGYLYGFLSIVMNQENPCEMSCIAVVFPLGVYLGMYVLYKEKMRNSLLNCLMLPFLLLFAYCTIGLPKFLAKVTFMTYSTPERAVDFLGVILAIITVVSISEIRDKDDLNIKNPLLVAILSVIPALIYCLPMDSSKIVKLIMIVMSLIIIILIVFLLTNHKCWRVNKYGAVFASVCLIVYGSMVHPIMVGTDAISSKPSTKEIQKIVSLNPEAKWIALDSIVSPEYLLACGAPTVNSVNFIPNYDLWNKIDPNNYYEEVWNRYSHFIISLGSDNNYNCELLGPDLIKLTVNKEILKKINISYVMTNGQIPNEWDDTLIELYHESNVWIYQVK